MSKELIPQELTPPVTTKQGIFSKLLEILMNPFKFIKEVLSHNGIGSSKRTVMFMSAVVLCFCLLLQ